MSRVSYKNYRDEFSFETVEDIVGNLVDRISRDAPKVWKTHRSDEKRSILMDVSFETLERQGLRTMRETTLVPYEFERPGVSVRVVGVYNSKTESLQKSQVKIVLGEYPDNAVVEFTVSPGGNVSVSATE